MVQHLIFAGWSDLPVLSKRKISDLTRIFHEKSIPMMDLLNSTALYSKNVLNVLSSTISLIFLHMPCRINHFHHLITKSHEIFGLKTHKEYQNGK